MLRPMEQDRLDIATLGSLALLGVVLRVPWAWLKPWPWDWDAAYYRLVARNLAQGDPAGPDSLWTLAAPEAGLGGPADLYWMPLPSWVLTPEIALGGAGLITVALLAALLGPLTYWITRAMNLSVPTAFVAGCLAATGGAWVRQLGTTDVYALTAVLGSVGLLGVVKGRWTWVALAIAGLALTRNDGFLMGFALAAGLTGWRIAAAAAVGPLVTGAWWTRSAWIGGDTFWTLRRSSGWALSYEDIFLGVEAAPALSARVWASVEALWAVGFVWLWAPLFLFVPLLIWGALMLRRTPVLRTWAVGFVVVPLATAALAPAVTMGGTLERTGIALLGAHAIVLAAGVAAAAGRLEELRGYHRWFTRGAVLLCWAGVVGWTAATFVNLHPEHPDCSLWSGVPDDELAFVPDPLLHEWQCGRAAALRLDEMTADRADELADRYGARWVFARSETPPEAFEGWQPAGRHRWRKPKPESAR